MEDLEEGFEIVEGIEEDFQDETDESAQESLMELIENLQNNAVSGMETFQDCSDASTSRIHAVFSLLDHHSEGLEPGVIALFNIAKDYDFNGLRANGYRSCLRILRCCCEKILEISHDISAGRDHMFLSLRSGYRDLESFVACLGQLKTCILHLVKLPESSENKCLFSKTDDSLFTFEAEQMLSEMEALNREPFYGRFLGTQFCKSMQNPLKMINVAMASFGESFNKDTIMNKWALSFMSSGKYFMNPELRAQQVVKTTQNSSIDFCKAFWNIAESDLLQELPMMVCPPVQISHGFQIHPEPLSLPKVDGSGMVDIAIPTCYHGNRPINVRLISHVIREGQEQLLEKDLSEIKVEVVPASPCLIVHCHGGGFVAQSAKSHEVYLRHWARGVGVPILSIDYSLAPESPYPRALEEIFYAYCWAVDNSDLLGSSGDRICFAGDSSGANLMLCTCLKAIQEGVRLPDGILSIYAATYVSYAPSPSRLLAVMDPLLPVGVLSRCLAAYLGYDSRDVFDHYVKKRQAMDDGWMDPVIQEKLKLLQAQQTRNQELLSGSLEDEKLCSSDDQKSVHTSESPMSGSGPSWPPERDNISSRPYSQREPQLSSQHTSEPPRSSPHVNVEQTGEKTSPSNGAASASDDVSSPSNGAASASDDVSSPSNGVASASDGVSSPSNGVASASDGVSSPSNGAASASASPSNGAASHSSSEGTSGSYKSASENKTSPTKPPGTVKFQIGSDQFVRESLDLSDEDFVSLEMDSPETTETTAAKYRLDSFKREASCDSDERVGNEPLVDLPRRSSECALPKARPTPTRSHSIVDFSTDKLVNESKFHWTSLVSTATKSKIKNNLTTIGNLVWGSGPNQSKTSAVQKCEETVLSSRMNLPLHAYRYLPVPDDPLISPYCASLDMLAKMPPVYLLACHLDPLLDDSIEFAKRLEAAGAEVHLDVFEDLPHGFLNFTLISREAKMGCDTCIVRIRQILLNTPR